LTALVTLLATLAFALFLILLAALDRTAAQTLSSSGRNLF
jgi:hypothetical protein